MKTAFTLLMLATASAAKKQTCTALALSGGGSNGAWESGVMWGLLNYGNPADYQYDVITGVSAGSINAMAMSGWEIGREVEMVQWLSDLWKDLHTSDVWVDWSLGKVSGVLIMGGAVDNSPLLNFMQQTMASFADFQKRIVLSSTEVNSGLYTEFDQSNTNFRDLPEAAFSSASIPTIFPQHVWKNRGVFMDGGTVYNINLEGAIRQCLEIVDDESQIVIDALFCGAPDEPTELTEVGKTWENFFRRRELRSYYDNSNSIAATQMAHPKVQLRHVIKQQEGLGGLDMIKFEGDFTWPIQTKGREQAQDALNGVGVSNVQNTITDWVEDTDIQKEFPQVADWITHR